MDINCIYSCEYQKDGKCCLSEIPATFVSSASITEKNEDMDCVYYKKRN